MKDENLNTFAHTFACFAVNSFPGNGTTRKIALPLGIHNFRDNFSAARFFRSPFAHFHP
jgi:hypothetical protein